MDTLRSCTILVVNDGGHGEKWSEEQPKLTGCWFTGLGRIK